MEKFYCQNCKKIFRAKGEKREWESPIYGKCWKQVAKCPVCSTECDEYRPRISSKKKETPPPSCGCRACGL